MVCVDEFMFQELFASELFAQRRTATRGTAQSYRLDLYIQAILERGFTCVPYIHIYPYICIFSREALLLPSSFSSREEARSKRPKALLRVENFTLTSRARPPTAAGSL